MYKKWLAQTWNLNTLYKNTSEQYLEDIEFCTDFGPEKGSSHVTTYFRTFVRTFERMLCRSSNIRVKITGQYPNQKIAIQTAAERCKYRPTWSIVPGCQPLEMRRCTLLSMWLLVGYVDVPNLNYTHEKKVSAHEEKGWELISFFEKTWALIIISSYFVKVWVALRCIKMHLSATQTFKKITASGTFTVCGCCGCMIHQKWNHW